MLWIYMYKFCFHFLYKTWYHVHMTVLTALSSQASLQMWKEWWKTSVIHHNCDNCRDSFIRIMAGTEPATSNQTLLMEHHPANKRRMERLLRQHLSKCFTGSYKYSFEKKNNGNNKDKIVNYISQITHSFMDKVAWPLSYAFCVW